MSDVTQRAGAALILWLCGSGLRLSILALPPVIVAVQRDLALTGTEVGLLSGLPIVFFAAAALPGSLLIARLGVLPTLVTGLIVTAFGSAARALAASAYPFYAATMLMSVGVAMMQPAMPAAVRDWLPSRIGFATALYTNGMIVGEILPAAMMLPIVVPLLDDSWRAAIAIWSVPLLAIALFASLVAPRDRPQGAGSDMGRPWWPEWRDPLIWRLGFILSSVNSTYFCSNAFLPAHLSSADRADLISPALTALNFGQLPASILLLAMAARLEARVWPYVGFGLGALGSICGIIFSASHWTVIWAGLLGFCCGAQLTLGLALAPLLCKPQDVPRVSAAMFTISYMLSVLVSIISGAIWDWTGTARASFFAVAVSALPIIILTPGLPFPRRHAFRSRVQE